MQVVFEFEYGIVKFHLVFPKDLEHLRIAVDDFSVLGILQAIGFDVLP